MNKEAVKEAVQGLVSEAAEVAKESVLQSLKEFDTSAIEELVNAEVIMLIEPLEEEIKNTSSWWVKIRNRMYVIAIKNSVASIVKNLKEKIATL